MTNAKEGLQYIVSGSISKDRIKVFPGKFSEVIKKDHLDKLSVSVLITEIREVYGGTAANIAYTLALLGESPILMSSVGHEAIAYIKKLASLGVSTEFVHYSDLPTADFTAIVDEENNQIGAFFPGAMNDHETLRLERWHSTDCIAMISPYNPEVMNRQALECLSSGMKYVYDPGQQIMYTPNDELRLAVQGAEIVFANEYESLFIADKLGIDIAELSNIVKLLIVTRGEKGCIISGTEINSEDIHIPAIQTNEVVDPTGAGDAFRAGFLFGYKRKLDVKICAQIGTVAATYAIKRIGAQEHYFELEEFVKK